jgi:hypothetical protein
VDGAEDSGPSAEDESAALLLDPDDPVVSANAIGIDAAAEPIPNAIASAPMRPTQRPPVKKLGSNRSERRCSIPRT